MLKGQTTISASPKTFDLDSIDFEDDGPSTITLGGLESMNAFDRVSTRVKVLKVSDPLSVTGGKKKQDVVVADSTGVGKVTLWEENIGKLTVQSSYLLKNFAVREYASNKYLSMGKEGSDIIPIEDIGGVEIKDAQIYSWSCSLRQVQGLSEMQSAGRAIVSTSRTMFTV